MDTTLFFLINHGLKNAGLDLIMPFVTNHSKILFFLLTIPFLLKDRKKWFLVMLLSLITVTAADMSCNMLKHLFQRPRPCHSLEGVRMLVGCGKSFSLPSGHATNAFAFAAAFSHFFRKSALPMFIIAALVAFSRIYSGVHYPADVIAGAILGGTSAGVIIILHSWSSKKFREEPYLTVFLIATLALAFFRYYYIAAGPLDLGPDEAHYWDWSRRLDLSYYSKGPAIAYIIAFTTWLMGDTVFAVRFFAPIFIALSSLLIYRLTLDIYNDSKKACAAALVFQIIPLFSVFGVVMTIDTPFVLFWTLSLYLFWKAVNRDKLCVMRNEPIKCSFDSSLITHHSSLAYWLLLGITIGLGLLTKYTMAFFPLCAFLFFIFSKDQRSWLIRKEPYFALILSLLVFSPVIIWNASHDWVTVRHTAGQAHISGQWSWVSGQRLKDFLEFTGSQIGVITPLLFFAVIYGSIKHIGASRYDSIPRGKGQGATEDKNSSLFLFWFWAPVLGFFILKSIHGKVQANWAMTAYITAIIASADLFLPKEAVRKTIKIFLLSSVVIAFMATAIVHYPGVLDLPVKMNPSSRFMGWRELGIKAGEVYNVMASHEGEKVFVFSDKYQISSELAFYMPGKPRTYCVNLGRRMNQYDIWGGLNELVGYDALFVTIDNGNFPEELRGAFDSYEKEEFEAYNKDKILRRYFIFKCYGFKGLSSIKTESY
ncbi:MAG: glycosyltransferase family 39 protein [Nitrospirae bacterium]|nr:glycosyltransferase family 39 protein [Nitrospirota bacterium]